MDSWIVGQVSFWYTVHEVQPAKLIDKMISVYLDWVVPGRGVGESTWWMRSLRTLEQTADRTRLETDIRRSLRDWDDRYPEIHHELIMRWLCGAAVSLVTTSVYNSIVRSSRRHNYRYSY